MTTDMRQLLESLQDNVNARKAYLNGDGTENS